uniref:Uncharacterized protein n=1 Tax=Brassica campestris TaxID=3711 RepID=A0A3P6C4W0_BRACM|nr:unnamed protein product [Brassica rapa]
MVFSSPTPSSISHNYVLIQSTNSLTIDRFDCLFQFRHLHFSTKYNFPAYMLVTKDLKAPR